MLEVRSLTRKFGGVAAVNNVSFELGGAGQHVVGADDADGWGCDGGDWGCCVAGPAPWGNARACSRRSGSAHA